MQEADSSFDIEFVYNLYIDFVKDFSLYLKSFSLYIAIWAFIYLLMCLVVYCVFARRFSARFRGALKTKRILIAVAHPDDECMFFGPAIYKLNEQGVDVHVLCMSNGNYDGKGPIRRHELWKACVRLGVPEHNICLVEDNRLPDDPHVQWPPAIIAHLIQYYIEVYDIDTLVTFDRGGVSSHANHSAMFYAVAYMFVEKIMPKGCKVYTLDTVNIMRKYWGYFDLPLSFILSSKRYFLRWTESRKVVQCMMQHKSQIVWFRRLYLILSRYMVINTLRQISLADIELELEVDD